ncbi:MAG TPA: FdtA/QdtA family cupin domain-containing protein [Chloroflexota bacterium]|nr:FdtA/QdtA family cupin domain-containing protein [Chloroflexota bacterium]
MTRLTAARRVALPTFVDSRGALTAFESNLEVPFQIARVFYVYDVQAPFERGGHAHVHADQLLVCVAGRMSVDLVDPSSTETYVLDDPSTGLFVPRLVWTRLYGFTPGAVCLAAASNHYEQSEVIRDWDEYVRRALEP